MRKFACLDNFVACKQRGHDAHQNWNLHVTPPVWYHYIILTNSCQVYLKKVENIFYNWQTVGNGLWYNVGTKHKESTPWNTTAQTNLTLTKSIANWLLPASKNQLLKPASFSPATFLRCFNKGLQASQPKAWGKLHVDRRCKSWEKICLDLSNERQSNLDKLEFCWNQLDFLWKIASVLWKISFLF